MVLEKINQPNDIKSLTDEELKILASEIREFLSSGGQQGRHLVVAPTSEGDEPAVRGENPPCRPRQYHRHLYQRRLYGRVG